MTKKKEEKVEENTIPDLEDLKLPEYAPMDDIWVLMLLSLLFWQPDKPEKVINIYMDGDK